MTKQQERDDFIIRLTRELPEVPVHQVQELARKLLRLSATLDRLACAQCNGDYPCDNGERKVLWCGRCQGGMVRAAMKRCKVQADTAGVDTVGAGKDAYYWLCQDCRTQDRVKALLAPYGIVPDFQGDPRGYVLRLKMPSGQSNTWAGDGVGVPA